MLVSIPHNIVHWDLFLCLLFQIGTNNCPKSSQVSVPDGYTFHRLMYCNVRALGTRANRAIVTITIKNPQNYFTQKQCFLPDSFIKVIQTPFWNKHIYPPFKADNSNSFCTLVRHSKLYTVAYMSVVVDYFSNSSTCYNPWYFLFKSTVSPSTTFTGCLKRVEGLCAPWYWPSGDTSTLEELFSKHHLDVQLQSGPTSLLSDFAHTGNDVHMVRDLCGLIHSHIFNTGSQKEANPLR